MMKHVNFKERKKAVQIVSKKSAVIAQRCRKIAVLLIPGIGCVHRSSLKPLNDVKEEPSNISS